MKQGCSPGVHFSLSPYLLTEQDSELGGLKTHWTVVLGPGEAVGWCPQAKGEAWLLGVLCACWAESGKWAEDHWAKSLPLGWPSADSGLPVDFPPWHWPLTTLAY